MTQQKIRYSQFWDRINVEAFCEAIGWQWEEEDSRSNLVGFCPFPQNHNHGDTTGKFAIHREGRVYNCWVCGGGDLLSLTMLLKDMDSDEATAWLYQFTDEDNRSDTEFTSEFLEAFRDVEKRVETLPYFNPAVLDQFKIDWANPPSAVIDYMESRWIDADTLMDFNVGYSNTILRRAPPRGKYAEDEDYFGPGIVFPHFWHDRLVGWQTRWLDDRRPDWIPKYTNTSDFPKENTLYAYHRCATHEPIAVVESVPSALFIRAAGYAAVATYGSSINPAQMRLLRRFAQGVMLFPDGDGAGEKWARELSTGLKRYVPVYVTEPVGEDLDVGDLPKLAPDGDPWKLFEALREETLENGEIGL